MSSLKTALRSEVATQKLQVKENAPVTSMENEARALLSEDAFVSMLYLERRRAERAQKRFVLVLVDVKRALEDGHKNRTLGKIGVALTNSTRETDILGWYLENNLVGIIGTELGETSPAVIHERLLEKLRAAFQHMWERKRARRFRFRFIFSRKNPGKANRSPKRTWLCIPTFLEKRTPRSWHSASNAPWIFSAVRRRWCLRAPFWLPLLLRSS